MPNSSHYPDLNPANRAVGVEHRSRLAQEVIGELGPFLAAEGLDLNDLSDTDLDTLNAGLARATARYNQSLEGAGPVASPVGGSPFIRTPSTHRSHAAETLDISSSQHRPEAAVRRDHAHGGRRPKTGRSDRTLVREFDGWLGEQPVIAAPSPGEESGMFGELLKVA